MKYIEFINSIPIEDNRISSMLTTGDIEYPGTALEVYIDNKELFEFVVNENGERQVIIYSSNTSHRLSFDLFEKIVDFVKKEVKYISGSNLDENYDINK